MTKYHFQFWPQHLPTTLAIPETTIYENLEGHCPSLPEKTAIYIPLWSKHA